MGDATDAGLDGLGKSLGEVIAERFNNPMITSFAIAWSLWNYKFFVILFSDAPIQRTFALIHQIQFNGWDWVLNGIAIPAAAAAFYIFILPIPSRFVYRFWKNSQKRTNDIKQEIEGQTLLTLEESRRMREALRGVEKKVDEERNETMRLREDIRQADERVRSLEGAVEAANLDAERLRRQLEENGLEDEMVKFTEHQDAQKTKEVAEAKTEAADLSFFQIKILNLLGSESFMAEEDLPRFGGDDRLKSEFEIGELLSHDYIKPAKNGFGREGYSLSQRGRAYLLRTRSQG